MKNKIEKPSEKIRDSNNKIEIWYIFLILTSVIFVISAHALWDNFPALQNEFEKEPSTVIRNFFWILTFPIGLCALLLAWKRTSDATRQTETQIRQANSAEIGQYHDRFQRALDMIDKPQQTIRLAGLSLLENIRKEAPSIFFYPINEVLCQIISDKFDRLEVLDASDLEKAHYESDFDPKFNSRILEYLMEDIQDETEKSPVSIDIGHTEIYHLDLTPSEIIKYRDSWSIDFSCCRIKSVEFFGFTERNITFDDSEIETLTLYLDFDHHEGNLIFNGCIFSSIVAYRTDDKHENLEKFIPENFQFRNCKLKNNELIDSNILLKKLLEEDNSVVILGEEI